MRTSLLALALLLAGCSNAAPERDPYAKGVAALAADDPRTARVQFLNAIQADPANAAARVMQARTYLALGDGSAAETEIAEAIKRGVAAEDVAHLLAHARLLRGEAQQALDALQRARPEHAAVTARLRAEALHALGDGGAGAAFDQAISLAPDDAILWTAVGRFRRDNGNLAGALEAADRAIRLKPRLVDALLLRGALTRSQYGLAAALPWFNRAVEVDSAHVPALLERAATLGDLGRANAMLADTRKILSLSEGNERAYYLQSTLAARAGKFDLARSLYARTKGRFDREPAAMLLASAIDFQTGSIEQAAQRLARLIDQQPGNRKARRLLAASYWRLGDPAATVAALRPIVDLPDADSYSLSLIGMALAKQGDRDGAARYLARAAQPQSRSPTAIGAPVTSAELAEIRAYAASRPGHAPAQLKLIGALLSNGIGDEALQRALVLQAANPGAPDAHVLVGDARGIGGDFAGAAEEYRKAANLAFTEPTAMRLIEALQRSAQPTKAAQVLQLFLQQNPQSVPARLMLATRMMETRDWPGAIRVYEGLRRRLGDRDAVMLNNLAWAYSEEGELEAALPLARKAWSLDKDNPATADTYGWLLVKSGRDKVQGLVLLERAARGAPTDALIRRHLEEARRN
ncbi:tetratricopeptide repeat protein [Sphingosinicella sp. LY1275]|uniref:tetratricopeptide repeat protein n=1 Tax=Sphingosinicella sp. LY1275 TaxID=3095379 RepID=UPI002ADECFEB|nr:tetratricopeptide repeat protein [Sphingosinicella sp. LY1275]MEA1015124.1 tetratricopeptide repeat protein [Sphingosinicella sp. LY1275]